jgi:hypothetical protein
MHATYAQQVNQPQYNYTVGNGVASNMHATDVLPLQQIGYVNTQNQQFQQVSVVELENVQQQSSVVINEMNFANSTSAEAPVSTIAPPVSTVAGNQNTRILMISLFMLVFIAIIIIIVLSLAGVFGSSNDSGGGDGTNDESGY